MEPQPQLNCATMIVKQSRTLFQVSVWNAPKAVLPVLQIRYVKDALQSTQQFMKESV